MEHETDEAILQRVARGEEAALAILHNRFAPSLFAIARRILGDGPEAQDALHEGFLHLWDKAAEYDPARNKAFPWAVTTFRSKVIDRLRASHRRLRLQEMAGESLLDEDGAPPEPADAPADRVERIQAVRRAMRSLPEEQRRCIERAFLHGLTYLQLSELAGTTPGTVKTNIRRGLMRLRDILQGGVS